MSTKWSGVFPAMTTQMARDGALDLEATAAHTEEVLRSGVSGLIFLGSLGENQSLSGAEKRAIMAEMVQVVAGRVPVLSGVAESSTAEAVRYARDCESMGVDGLMLMPPMIYKSPDPRETEAHLRMVARGCGLPIMIYNNPISYGHDVSPSMFAKLADEKSFVALKESSGDPRRITDLRRLVGDRYTVFTGVDDLMLESAILGIDGWVAGLGVAFPCENQRIWEASVRGDWEEARSLYRWYSPLLHLDVHPKFVQYIKLAVQEAGLGREWVRAPRLPLKGPERRRVLDVIHEGIRARPEPVKGKGR
jgi:1-pyrroline-4-hydroxy-2-carboxylate deaminase